MKVINEKQSGDRGYVVIFNDQTVCVYAPSRYDAKLKGLAHFKPRKSQAHMVQALAAARSK